MQWQTLQIDSLNEYFGSRIRPIRYRWLPLISLYRFGNLRRGGSVGSIPLLLRSSSMSFSMYCFLEIPSSAQTIAACLPMFPSRIKLVLWDRGIDTVGTELLINLIPGDGCTHLVCHKMRTHNDVSTLALCMLGCKESTIFWYSANNEG